MARSTFGGSDLGNFFAGLYRQETAQAEADARYAEAQAKQAAQEAKYAQQAADADALSMWQNGMISDQEWLGYIAERIAATAGDAKEQTKWIKYQRTYERQIADNQAQFNYEQGGSIADLIAYHEGVLAELDPDSQEYRERVGVVNQLVDNQIIENVNAGAEAILDKIEDGEATYKDLLAFYKSALPKAREGSSLRESIQEEIEKVTDKIAANRFDEVVGAAEYKFKGGKITGKKYAEILRKEAEAFKDKDPGRYWQIMQVAQQAEQYDASKAAAGAASGRAASTKALKEKINDQGAVVYSHQGVTEALDAGSSRYVDPFTGKVVEIKSATDRANAYKKNDLAYYSAMDKLASLQEAAGDEKAAALTRKRKIDYMVNKGAEHNAIPYVEQLNQIASAWQSSLEGATDPDRAQATSMDYAQKMLDVATKAEANTKVQTLYFGKGNRIIEDRVLVKTGPKKDTEQVSGEFIQSALQLGEAMQVLANPGTTAMQADQIMQALPPEFKKLAATVWGTTEDIAGLRNGTKTMVAARSPVTGKYEWLAADIDEQGQPLVPDFNEGKQIKVPIMVDGKGGNIETRWVVADVVTPKNAKIWVATKGFTYETKGGKQVAIKAGQTIPTSVWNDMSRSEQRAFFDGGMISEQYAANGTYAVVKTPSFYDKNGKLVASQTWVQDPVTLRWFPGDKPPVRGGTATASDGSAFVNDKGEPEFKNRPFQQAGGVPFIYLGRDTGKAAAHASALRALNGDDPGNDIVVDALGKAHRVADLQATNPALLAELLPDDRKAYNTSATYFAFRSGEYGDTYSENAAIRSAKKVAKETISQATANWSARKSMLAAEKIDAAREGDYGLVAKLDAMAKSVGIKGISGVTPNVNPNTGFVVKAPAPSKTAAPVVKTPTTITSSDYSGGSPGAYRPVAPVTSLTKVTTPTVATSTLNKQTYSGSYITPTTGFTVPKTTTTTTKTTTTTVKPPTTAERIADNTAKQTAARTGRAVAS